MSYVGSYISCLLRYVNVRFNWKKKKIGNFLSRDIQAQRYLRRKINLATRVGIYCSNVHFTSKSQKCHLVDILLSFVSGFCQNTPKTVRDKLTQLFSAACIFDNLCIKLKWQRHNVFTKENFLIFNRRADGMGKWWRTSALGYATATFTYLWRLDMRVSLRSHRCHRWQRVNVAISNLRKPSTTLPKSGPNAP